MKRVRFGSEPKWSHLIMELQTEAISTDCILPITCSFESIAPNLNVFPNFFSFRYVTCSSAWPLFKRKLLDQYIYRKRKGYRLASTVGSFNISSSLLQIKYISLYSFYCRHCCLLIDCRLSTVDSRLFTIDHAR